MSSYFTCLWRLLIIPARSISFSSAYRAASFLLSKPPVLWFPYLVGLAEYIAEVLLSPSIGTHGSLHCLRLEPPILCRMVMHIHVAPRAQRHPASILLALLPVWPVEYLMPHKVYLVLADEAAVRREQRLTILCHGIYHRFRIRGADSVSPEGRQDFSPICPDLTIP